MRQTSGTPGEAIPSALLWTEDLGQVAVGPAGVALAEAEFILYGGSRVKDWDGCHQPAKILGATEGASRVAVDDGFMARHRQVGVTPLPDARRADQDARSLALVLRLERELPGSRSERPSACRSA